MWLAGDRVDPVVVDDTSGPAVKKSLQLFGGYMSFRKPQVHVCPPCMEGASLHHGLQPLHAQQRLQMPLLLAKAYRCLALPCMGCG